ncbi:hypothetical protein [Streptomyces yaizuensis]|nr:hypothetical protein [Streptomyces sp. YSPA8]
MRHLIDDSLPLTVKLLHHLTMLAVSDRPLVAHRTTLLARNLVASRLESNPEQTCSVIAQHVSREPEMLFSHRGQVSYWNTYTHAEHQEEKARAVMDLYRAVLEGDVKRTATVVMELMGKTVPQGASLSTVRNMLSAEDDQPLCKLLASTIRSEWRNANAHEDFHWDPVNNVLLLSGQSSDLEQVLDAAVHALTVCHGFEHGVAVAYAQNPSLITWGSEGPNHVSRDLSIAQAAGEARFPVLDLRRQGNLMRLDIADLSIETLREALRALLRSAMADPGVERWELRQTSPDRISLCVDRSGMSAGLQVAELLWGTMDPLPFASLPLLTNAMALAGEHEEATASVILCLAASHVVGERDRLSPALAQNGSVAKDELTNITKLISDGVRAAAHLLDGAAQRKLLAFAEVLAGERHRLIGAPPYELVHGFVPADRTLRRHAPARLPWLTALSAPVV